VLREGKRLLTEGLVIPAYEQVLKGSHLFNTLDARGAVSVSERTLSILKVRELACAVARAYVDSLAGDEVSA
jgi:glycyl-tRNA synthetase alpha chain